MTTCRECGASFDQSLSPIDDLCPDCFDKEMTEVEEWTAWWEALTPYEQDEQLKAQGIDPFLLQAETVILIKQLLDEIHQEDKPK